MSDIEYYWRPGCPFCMRLEHKLKRYDLPMQRHNIWENADAAARVRSVAGGNETVPTLIVGDHAMVNPSADQVMTALGEVAPELVPDGWEPPDGTRLTRAMSRLFRE